MKLLEIKNNLVKLSYAETEVPVLGRFIVLASESKSYVAQFVNLKSDTVSNFAIAKLLFTFTNDGVVDNYDGSIPDINSELSLLPASELLALLPVENPLKIGMLAQQDDMLVLDASIFERNLTVFAENDIQKTTFISNSIRQLFQMREKSVIIDTYNLFEDYEKIEFGVDFKLPLNAKMIDYIFDQELAEVDASTKAIIQDIFYAVQEYIKSLEFEFLPIDNFVDVVTNQYRETQMPELALLKNKLLKYRDSNVFANSTEEVFALKKKLEDKNASVIDLKNIPEVLQNEVIGFIHEVLNSFDKYVYLFVSLTDENSDKKLLKQFLNHNHVFTTVFVSSSYKYADELRQHAQNMIVFAPNNANHDFAAYNTFLNKLNTDEAIVYGKLTQGIPFIVAFSDLDLDLTRDDVLGERYQFIPVVEDLQLVKVDNFGNKIPVASVAEEKVEETPLEPADQPADKETIAAIPVIEQAPIEVVESEEMIAQPAPEPEPELEVQQVSVAEPVVLEEQPLELPSDETDMMFPEPPMIEEAPVYGPEMPEDPSQMMVGGNEMPDDILDSYSQPMIDDIVEPEAAVLMPEENISLGDDLDNLLSETSQEESVQVIVEEEPQVVMEDFPVEETLTEDDLNFLEENQLVQNEEPFNIDQAVDSMFEEDEANFDAGVESYEEISYAAEDTPPVVPVYPAEEETEEPECEFESGDRVSHHRYGRGIVDKVIKYGNKTLCSITFENVGRRLLDPTITELTKIF